MAKILSVIVFFTALYWSWGFVRSERPVSEYIHIGIQDDLKRLISEYIQENLPTAKNLRFERFWTETIKKNQVKAFFVYSFEDENEKVGPARVEIEGYAILNKSGESQDVVEWSFDELYILNNQVEFKDPIRVGGKDEPAKPESETPKAKDESTTNSEH